MSTYEPIASQTLGSAAASVTFSSIPQGYTDLRIVMNPSVTTGTDNICLRFNGDTTSNYSRTTLGGDGSTAQSARNSSVTFYRIDFYGYLSTVPSFVSVDVMNYNNSTTFKTAISRVSNAGNGTSATVCLWRKTPEAINSVTLFTEASTNFAAGSTFTLYGIQVGDKAQKAQGGNIVTTDGTYVYHTFTSSGAFIPSQALTVDYLVVAGGGGGGRNGGGGGGGGLRSTVTATGGGGSLESALSLSAGKSYPVIVGAGGTGTTSNTVAGLSGSNSVFHTITSTGGGGSGIGDIAAGQTGGSGGGGGYNLKAGGSGTANQGYAGGAGSSGNSASNTQAGGGGGAGAVGSAGTTSPNKGGNGGNGVAVSISGSSVTYAGGGGGGSWNGTDSTGGTGGGGIGRGSSAAAGNGTANTGGGGGDAGYTSSYGTSGNGGSGIVIIRYLA